MNDIYMHKLIWTNALDFSIYCTLQGSPFNAHLDVSSGALDVYLWPETVWCMQARKALEGLVFEPGQAA